MPKHLTVLLCLLLTALAVPARGAQPHGAVTAELNTTELQQGQQAELAVVVDISSGLHAQSHQPLDKNLIPFEVKVRTPAGITAYDAIYPKGEIHDYSGLGTLSVYSGQVIVYVPLQVAAQADAQDVTIKGTVEFQACNNSACFSPEKLPFVLRTKIVPRGQVVVPATQQALFKGFDQTIFSRLGPGGSAAPAAIATPAAMPRGAVLSFFGHEIHVGTNAYGLAFGIAFVVGILFNLMPCVFPVLPLKVYGFYETAQHDRGKCFALGAVFSMGVVASFGVLGLLVLVFKKLSWGEQFSNPWFVGAVVLILVAMALGMFGLFSVLLPTGIYNLTPRHDTYQGNFLMGVLATVLSTPCTAPMFAGLMVWASAQPHRVVGLMMMLTVGVGMAFPYLLLSAFPNLAKRLPRSGAWGELIKQMMGFLLLAVAAYFAVATFAAGRTVTLGNVVLEGRSLFWLIFAIIAAGCVYLVARTVRFSHSALGVLTAVVIALLMSGVTFLITRPLAHTADGGRDLIAWQPYTDEAFAKARESGRTVMVEFTASWCVNCQALEATVFHDPRVAEAILRQGVIPLRADMTHENEPAHKRLDQLNAAGGIPLTAIYEPGEDEPAQLSSVYSTQNLLEAIKPVLTHFPTSPPNDTSSTPSIHIIESHVAFAGAIRISGDIPSADNENFTCAEGFKGGSQFAASGSWSMDTDSVDVDGRSAHVPTIAMLPCSDGSSLCVFPAVLTAIVDIKAGQIINSDGFDIETTRDVKIGARISVFRVVPSAFVSIGKDDPSAMPELTKPWFIAVKHVTRINDRSLALEAWRAEWHRLLYR